MAAPDFRPTLPPRPIASQVEQRRRAGWGAYVWGAIILLSLFVAAPLAIGSVIRQLVFPPQNQVYDLSPAAEDRDAVTPDTLRVSVAALDETKRTATMRLSGYRACATGCRAVTLRFFALDDKSEQHAGPPSATVALAEGAQVITESFTLPIRGTPNLYPFDHYDLRIGTTRVQEDGAASAAPSLDRAAIPVTVESDVTRFFMREPEIGGPDTLAATTLHPAFQSAIGLEFTRPVYLKILTCLLVALIAGAAILAVSTEPLRRLVVGVGGMILGVWGIRSILAADAPPVVTVVDLLLCVVLLILLYGIAVRLFLVWRRGGWDGLVATIRSAN